MNSSRLSLSFISPKLEIKRHKIHGLGMFANKDIRKGEIVITKGGHILTRNELYYSADINSYLPLMMISLSLQQIRMKKNVLSYI